MPITQAASGHRPDKLGGYSPKAWARTYCTAYDWLYRTRPDHAISGMALGWDLAFARAALDLAIPLTAAIPFPQQPARWSTEWIERWARIRSQAHTVKYLADAYSIAALQHRNRWMVDNCDLLVVLFDGSKGGTRNCTDYARKRECPVTNLWAQFSINKGAS